MYPISISQTLSTVSHKCLMAINWDERHCVEKRLNRKAFQATIVAYLQFFHSLPADFFRYFGGSNQLWAATFQDWRTRTGSIIDTALFASLAQFSDQSCMFVSWSNAWIAFSQSSAASETFGYGTEIGEMVTCRCKFPRQCMYERQIAQSVRSLHSSVNRRCWPLDDLQPSSDVIWWVGRVLWPARLWRARAWLRFAYFCN
jgi:hypothetical protein